jgi:hypothetical protein
MAGHTIRPNHPGGRPPVVEGAASEMASLATRAPSNVRRLQRRLWAAAKRSPGRRFHALYDRIYRSDVLWEAWERVRRNRGAAGVDRVTLAEVEAYGVERLLGELQADLRQGRYGPRRSGAWPFPSRMVVCGRWASRRCATGSCSRRRGLCWSRSSRPTSSLPRLASGPAARRRRPVSASGRRSRAGMYGSPRPTSATSSARSTSGSCWRSWPSESRIGGCSSCCARGSRRV